MDGRTENQPSSLRMDSIPEPQVLNHYGVADYGREILRYTETFAERVARFRLSDEELDLGLREGFFIGERKSHIGDYLTYSNLPRLLKQTYPGCRVVVAPHRLARQVFEDNPFVDAITDLPGREPVGAFREFGWGNTHQRRCRIFRIDLTDEPVPELRPRPQDRQEAAAWRRGLPADRRILLVHSSGRTVRRVLPTAEWRRLYSLTRHRLLWVQLRFPGDQAIPCDRTLRGLSDIRQVLAFMEVSDLFLGINSGPMHIHASLRRPGVILHSELRAEEVVFPVLGDNLCLPRPVNHHLFHCYSFHTHVCLKAASPLPEACQGVPYSAERLAELLLALA